MNFLFDLRMFCLCIFHLFPVCDLQTGELLFEYAGILTRAPNAMEEEEQYQGRDEYIFHFEHVKNTNGPFLVPFWLFASIWLQSTKSNNFMNIICRMGGHISLMRTSAGIWHVSATIHVSRIVQRIWQSLMECRTSW
jgi:hypothetical protein